MALDVHIIRAGSRQPEAGSYTSLGFGDEHEDIYRPVSSVGPDFPQLTRMWDYYDDVVYEGDDLAQLIAEIERAMPQVSADAQATLARFRRLCQQAQQEGKTILLFAE
jgi:hypothetical protein